MKIPAGYKPKKPELLSGFFAFILQYMNNSISPKYNYDNGRGIYRRRTLKLSKSR
jgi:hypothetical protein